MELKIPPPVVGVLIAGGMWGLARVAPLLDLPDSIRVSSAVALALAGAAIEVAGAISFLRVRTTVNPMKPHRTSSLVTSGMYRYSRNPMYAGQLLLLVGWAVYLSSFWALAGPLAFVLYLNRFQIEPEERALSATFGATYSEYRMRVRRWL